MTDEQFSKLLALLTEIRDALAPGPLEWVSGVVVPILLGVVTLLVAIWATRTAREANRLTKGHHDEDAARVARDRRVAYAQALIPLMQVIALRKMAGEPEKFDDLTELRRLQAACDDPTAKQIEMWARSQIDTAEVPDSSQSGKAFLELILRVRNRIELWMEDPQSAESAKRSDDYRAAVERMARDKGLSPTGSD